MIHFFKQKPYLQDFIPENHVDIHSHLLPNIDDGARTIEETETLLLGLEKIGIKKFVTTPHVMGEIWKNSSEDITEKKENTLQNLSINGIRSRFKAAAEYMIDAEFNELFKKEKLLTVKENYVLVEISYLNPPIQLFDILFELQVAGYKPILAHPERYNFYHNSIDNYKKLKNAGCYFQMNMLSANGYYGEKVAKSADALLKNNLIDFIGSDVHHTRHLDFLNKKIVLKNFDYLPQVFQNNSIFDF
ncbi:tyrosine-protein phosphatase [Flavobacterium capsici]|uniref:protein-tyrosine-phosphatase n=1 Tax=Flavobacterium capsici TaxID=3075618 RepID=A0AA96EY53_9FLAO|nr:MULTISPECIES: CpsB/CapC family capsule biosynthesis tyrosine phosphatase [unclassified Flavobacterium]WNM20242.1 CpsB/CapC family capsule biosynthesis tyrosine phosphatase [Flavobacterium sp. PMR2A8]WNM21632.1 CpsB/CapC family capsule biosynthesis tyrosine phosphatase [Flavobacterium sp. PMTSA4]